jgi:hypothetical protein
MCEMNYNQTQEQLLRDIYRRAPSFGVDPNLAVGVAAYEGINGHSNPLRFSGDNGNSFGPFQLNTAMGLGKIFERRYGPLTSGNWSQQLDFSLGHLANDASPWNAIGDFAGTHGNNSNTGPITAAGARIAQQLGLAGGEGTGSLPGIGAGYDQSILAQLYTGAAPAQDFAQDYPGQPIPSWNSGADSSAAFGGSDQSNFIRAMTPDELAAGQGAGDQGGGGKGLPGPIGDLFKKLPKNPLTDLLGKGGGLTPQTDQFASSGAAGQDSSAGQPVFLTDPNAVATKAGKSVQEGAQKLGSNIKETGSALDQTLNSDTGQVTGTATGLTQYLGNLVYDVFPRIAVAAGAVIMLGMGLWLIGRNAPQRRVEG